MAWYISAVSYFWGLFLLWLKTIFIVPFENLDMLWLLVPIWLGWFFAEFFQEKVSTSRGNAISNAVIVLWGSIDCARQTVSLITEGTLKALWEIFLRFSIVGFLFCYGAFIVWLGVTSRNLVKYVGRVREVTYVFVMFVPIIYNAIPFSWEHVIAAIIFFPIFYAVIELIDMKTPNPRSVEDDIKEGRAM
jgi:hypothetical protein